MAEKKEKRYVSDNAQLIAEWNWKKNKKLGIEPNKITFGSIKKVWWICEKGHEWEATPNNRSNGRGCPACAKVHRTETFNKSKILSQGSLATESPQLSEQWHPSKNGELTPRDVTPNSGKKVWWKCQQGHEWQASIKIAQGTVLCAAEVRL